MTASVSFKMGDLPDIWRIFVEDAQRELEREQTEPGLYSATNVVVCTIITKPYGLIIWPAALFVAWRRRRRAAKIADAIIRSLQ